MRPLAICLGSAACLLSLAAATTHSAGSSAVIVPDDQRGGRRLSLRDADDHPLTVRVRIEPSSWAKRVRLGALGVSSVSDVIVDGDARVPLVAGAYRVVVSHRPEWSLHAEDVRIAAGVDVERAIELRREVAFVSNGPLVMLSAQGASAGELVRVRARVLAIELKVLAPSWMLVETMPPPRRNMGAVRPCQELQQRGERVALDHEQDGAGAECVEGQPARGFYFYGHGARA